MIVPLMRRPLESSTVFELPPAKESLMEIQSEELLDTQLTETWKARWRERHSQPQE
jgi:hypothetical protein